MTPKMEMSDTGIALVKQYEGFRSQTYLDVAGKPTIGYGHLIKSGETFNGPISDQQATELLRQDLQTAEDAVNRLVTVALTQGQYDALVDFTYNEGQGQLETSTLLSVINKGQLDAAPDQFLRWIYAGGKVQPGLVSRREAEAKLWES